MYQKQEANESLHLRRKLNKLKSAHPGKLPLDPGSNEGSSCSPWWYKGCIADLGLAETSLFLAFLAWLCLIIAWLLGWSEFRSPSKYLIHVYSGSRHWWPWRWWSYAQQSTNLKGLPTFIFHSLWLTGCGILGKLPNLCSALSTGNLRMITLVPPS